MVLLWYIHGHFMGDIIASVSKEVLWRKDTSLYYIFFQPRNYVRASTPQRSFQLFQFIESDIRHHASSLCVCLGPLLPISFSQAHLREGENPK